MGVSHHHARRFIGQSVAVHCHGGQCHYGIIRHVTPDCIVLERVGSGYGPVGTNSQKLEVTTADKPGNAEMREVGFGGFGGFGFGRSRFLALPLFTLLAITLAGF
jgi:hypothetical protein